MAGWTEVVALCPMTFKRNYHRSLCDVLISAKRSIDRSARGEPSVSQLGGIVLGFVIYGDLSGRALKEESR